MCVDAETSTQRGRHLSKATEQVNERGETRIICVLGVGLGSRRDHMCSSVVWLPSERLGGWMCFPASLNWQEAGDLTKMETAQSSTMTSSGIPRGQLPAIFV